MQRLVFGVRTGTEAVARRAARACSHRLRRMVAGGRAAGPPRRVPNGGGSTARNSGDGARSRHDHGARQAAQRDRLGCLERPLPHELLADRSRRPPRARGAMPLIANAMLNARCVTTSSASSASRTCSLGQLCSGPPRPVSGLITRSRRRPHAPPRCGPASESCACAAAPRPKMSGRRSQPCRPRRRWRPANAEIALAPAPKGSTVVDAVDPAGRTSASEPKATKARMCRGADLEAMIDTRGVGRLFHAAGLVPSSSRATPQRVGRSWQCRHSTPETTGPADSPHASQCQWCPSARLAERPRVAPATAAPRHVSAKTTSKPASSNTSETTRKPQSVTWPSD